ncbi:MarR family EPS-associated transcriptional regulator [Oxalicibacterium faecigallinarum]|nr:MarR family EPS-associated transcriptional regulator [Oxalicibacterium faecigallinarum]
MLTDEYRYKILKLLEQDPSLSQRDLAAKLDISLGKVNYCLKALVDVGVLKISNFKDSSNKLAYMYLLTPKGLEEKAEITLRFLKHKILEYESLKREIELLRSDLRHENNKDTTSYE